jgi:hypothetical protein
MTIDLLCVINKYNVASTNTELPIFLELFLAGRQLTVRILEIVSLFKQLSNGQLDIHKCVLWVTAVARHKRVNR